ARFPKEACVSLWLSSVLSLPASLAQGYSCKQRAEEDDRSGFGNTGVIDRGKPRDGEHFQENVVVVARIEGADGNARVAGVDSANEIIPLMVILISRQEG